MGVVRTGGVEEELLVVDPTGVPVPLAPAALAVASRRGVGEDVEEHDRAERTGSTPDSAAHLVPELKEQQLELGTRVCSTLDEVAGELRSWRGRAEAAANAVGASIAALATSPVAVRPVQTEGDRYQRLLERFGRTAEEVLTCGCHVHVSVAGDEELVTEGVATILRRGTGADLRRRIHRESGGDLRAVVRAAAGLTTAQATASLPG